MTMNFNEVPEFAKEFKRLIKRYKSLSGDLEEFKRVITVEPLGNSKHFNVITRNDRCTVVKARLFCRYLKGSSLRIIYAFHCNNLRLILSRYILRAIRKMKAAKRIKAYLNNF